MSNEFKHASVGDELTQEEFESVGLHQADGQAAGDVLYFDGANWKRRPDDIGARVYHSANQSIPDAVWTSLAFNSERWDTDAIHDTAANNSRLTCKTAGKYLVAANVAFATSSSGQRAVGIIKNGVSTYWAWNQIFPVASSYTGFGMVTVMELAVNDYIECRVYQNSGGALDCVSVGNFSPEFMMQRIG